jgi:hypothetical protein
MKKFKLLVTILLTSIVVACGGSSNDETGTQDGESVVSYEGMTKLDLREHGFEGTIYIPNDDFGQPIIERTNWGSVMIKVGERFGIELQQEPLSYDMFMSELMEDQVYETEFLEQTPPLLFWKNSIPDSGIEPEYHFFYTYSKEGFNVSISSFQSEQYTESAIKKMITSAKSYDHSGE